MLSFGRLDGWLHGLYIACVAFPLYNIGAKIAISQYGGHPLIFLCFGSLLSSLFLIVYAGRGNLALQSIRTLDTWVFSFLNLAALSFGLSLLVYVSALQGSILIRFTSVVCFIIALIMGQSTSKKELFFSFSAFLGIAILFLNLNLEKDQKAISLLLIIGASVCQALRQLLSEFHATNNKARSMKDNARVAGIVSSVSSFALIIILLFFALYQKFFGVVIFESAPLLLDFFNFGTIMCALVFAGVFTSVSKYCEFYAAKSISAKYLSAMVSLVPLFVLIYEMLFNYFSDNSISLSKFDLISLFLLIFGNAGIAISAIIKMKKSEKETELREKYITASEDNVEYAYKLVNSTMHFTNNDIKKTSKILDVEEDVIIDLLALDDFENAKLSKLQFHTLNKNYYLNVSTKDSLTSLENRGSLEQKIKELLYTKKEFSLCFIDLNKFKSINDLHGHDMGDKVLQHTANLMMLSNPKGINGRNGGDEFIMIVFDDVDLVIKKFEKSLSKKFKCDGISLDLSASIGVSSSLGIDNLDSLIKQADANMYQQKKIG